jgi:hypothetical protein
MPNSRFIICFKFSNVRAEVWVNGIPVGMVLPDISSPMAIPVNDVLVRGRNTMGIVLHAGPVPSRAREPWLADTSTAAYAGPAALSMNIAQYDSNQAPFSVTPPPIAVIEWQGTAVPQPSYIEREFYLSAGLGPWAWEAATRFSALDGVLRAHVLDYIAYLHGLLATGQFDSFIAQSSAKLGELSAGAYGISAARMRRTMVEALQSHSQPPYALDPLNLDTVDLRLVADGRMIECLRPDRRYILQFRTPDDGDVFFLPTMIGQAGGYWSILR